MPVPGRKYTNTVKFFEMLLIGRKHNEWISSGGYVYIYIYIHTHTKCYPARTFSRPWAPRWQSRAAHTQKRHPDMNPRHPRRLLEALQTCSVLQSVAVCCSVSIEACIPVIPVASQRLFKPAVCGSVLQCLAAYCSGRTECPADRQCHVCACETQCEGWKVKGGKKCTAHTRNRHGRFSRISFPMEQRSDSVSKKTHHTHTTQAGRSNTHRS